MASGKPSRIAATLRISDSVGKAKPGRAYDDRGEVPDKNICA